jgi:predicted dehydrogenase
VDRQIRVGIIGTGGMAVGSHIPNFLKHPAVKLTAFCDVNHDSVQAAGRRFGVPDCLTDYRDLISRAPVDLVAVCTSNDQHAPASILACERGLHVLCEKPLALSVAQAEAMQAAATKAGVNTSVNFSYRQNPAVRFIKDIISSGDLGQIYQVTFEYVQGYLSDPAIQLHPARVWRAQKSIAGQGALGDLGSHMIDLAHYWFGEMRSVQALMKTYVTERPLIGGGAAKVDCDDTTMALFDFRAGMIGSLHTSWAASPWNNHQHIEIYGARGGIVYENENQQSIMAVFGAPMVKYRAMAKVDVPASYHNSLTTHQFAFVESILRDERYDPGFAEGLACQRVIDAVAESARTGTRVGVP